MRTIHNERKFLFLVFRSLYAYSHAFSTAFLAIVHTFLRRPKYPLACFIIFFLRALEATAFTDLGILIYCFEEGGKQFCSFRPASGLDTSFTSIEVVVLHYQRRRHAPRLNVLILILSFLTF